jgi:general secretion pathway protein G
MKARGFTLVELLIVVAIMALLASIAAPLAELSYQRGKEQELRTALREIREAIDTYKRAADDGKIEKSADSSGYPPSLKALVEGVPDKSSPEKSTLYFLRRIPRDPISGEEWGVRAYASPANDPQAGKDVYDVYSKSEEIGLNKVPYKEW